MPAIYEHPILVLPTDIDAQGHANNLCYLRWMLDAALAHSALRGWPPEAYRARGVSWVVRSHQIRYLEPAYEGQSLVVRTWVASFKRASSLRRYRILRPADGRLLASAETEWAFVDTERKALTRILPEVAASFVVVDEPPGRA